MRYVGVLLIIIGTWFFFHPDSAVQGIGKNFYKKSNFSVTGWKIKGAKLLSLLWVLIGILIFLKK